MTNFTSKVAALLAPCKRYLDDSVRLPPRKCFAATTPLGYPAFVNGNAALVSEIKAEIARNDGRITFERFMELALYHPQYGYYAKSLQRTGKDGDYFTSVSVGPLFGKLLAKQFLKWRDDLGNPPEFEVVEFGGHRGQLRNDVLAAVPDLRYQIVEVGADRRTVRSPTSHGAPGGRALPESIAGVVFSNEFLDALPVHRVKVDADAWREIYVTEPEPTAAPHKRGSVSAHSIPVGFPSRGGVRGGFSEVLGPLSTPRLAEYLHDLPAQYMEGYQTEVNLRALDWMEDVARRLKRGFVLTMDYGYERADYFAPQHRDGTLLCYHQHTKNANPYANIGEQDITAHVEFTSLIEHGKKFDLEPVLFTDQSHFLLQIGEAEIAEIAARTAGQLSHERAAIHQLIHPEMMGRTFKVLVQKKSV